MHIDTEAGAVALFEQTFNGTLFSTWDEQPAAFKDDMRRKATAVVQAAVVDEPGDAYTFEPL